MLKFLKNIFSNILEFFKFLFGTFINEDIIDINNDDDEEQVMEENKKDYLCDTCMLSADSLTQRDNILVYPSESEYPNAAYRTSWKNMCNVTSYCMALKIAGWKIPSGTYEQAEDNLAYFILTDPEVLAYYEKTEPSLYIEFKNSFTDSSLTNATFPNEVHSVLSYGTNKWIGKEASSFNDSADIRSILYNNVGLLGLPLVLSVKFNGMHHVVCCTGVRYSDCIANVNEKTTPEGIYINDPWGIYNPYTDEYDSKESTANIYIPWDIVISKFKPLDNENTKWCHTFTAATGDDKQNIEIVWQCV